MIPSIQSPKMLVIKTLNREHDKLHPLEMGFITDITNQVDKDALDKSNKMRDRIGRNIVNVRQCMTIYYRDLIINECEYNE